MRSGETIREGDCYHWINEWVKFSYCLGEKLIDDPKHPSIRRIAKRKPAKKAGGKRK